MPTDGRMRSSERSTRLERLADLESRATLAGEIVVVVNALAPSRLQFHLAITSRIDLIL